MRRRALHRSGRFRGGPPSPLAVDGRRVDKRRRPLGSGLCRRVVHQPFARMLELGQDAASIHRRVGGEIAKRGIDVFIGVRGLGNELVAGAKEGGLEEANFAADSVEAGKMLCDVVREGDVVLVKGSRGVRTEKVIDALLEKFELEGNSAAAS